MARQPKKRKVEERYVGGACLPPPGRTMIVETDDSSGCDMVATTQKHWRGRYEGKATRRRSKRGRMRRMIWRRERWAARGRRAKRVPAPPGRPLRLMLVCGVYCAGVGGKGQVLSRMCVCDITVSS